MEENKSGTIQVRIPVDKVEALDHLANRLGMNRSKLIKFALHRFMDLVDVRPFEELVKEIDVIAKEWRVPRPTRYRPRRSQRPMLVSENVDNPWETPKKRGRKKKGQEGKEGEKPDEGKKD